MGAGKTFSILGGIFTLISTYFLTFWSSGTIYGSGIIAIVNIPDMFTNPSVYAGSFPEFMGYVVAALLLFFLIAGILELAGASSRGASAMGGLLAIIGGLYFLLSLEYSALPAEISLYSDILFGGNAIIDGILPFHISIGNVGLGTYILVAGGVLGLMGAILPREKY
jgi:hypothetical protein